MSPNTVQTAVRYVLGVACMAGVAILTCACKASGHIDFEIDLPVLELAAKPPAGSTES